MERCPGCGRMVRWYHKKGGGDYLFNSTWHRKCAYSWNNGYNTASCKANEVAGRFGLPPWFDLYLLDQPQPQPEHIYINLRKEFRKKYKIGPDNLIKINLGEMS
jgi:hypothetical protein